MTNSVMSPSSFGGFHEENCGKFSKKQWSQCQASWRNNVSECTRKKMLLFYMQTDMGFFSQIFAQCRQLTEKYSWYLVPKTAKYKRTLSISFYFSEFNYPRHGVLSARLVYSVIPSYIIRYRSWLKAHTCVKMTMQAMSICWWTRDTAGSYFSYSK